MSQPVIKYTLTKQGRQPEWLSSDSRAFKGEHSTSANKAGKLPRFGSPQDTIMLGIGAGDPDSDGTPDGYVGTIGSKADLQTYVTEVGTAADYHVVTLTVTGIQTSVTTGLSTAWDAINSEQGYQGGLSTTTSAKQTFSGIGTAVGITTNISTSKSETTTDGVTTRTDTVTTTETTKFRTSYDYAAEATRLWDIYEAINS